MAYQLRRALVDKAQERVDAVEEREGHREEEGLLAEQPEEDVALASE